MSFSFDDLFDDAVSESPEQEVVVDETQYEQESAAQVLEQLRAPVQQVADPKLTQVQVRLKVSQYIVLLLENDLFDDRSEPARLVENMVKGFLTVKLEELMGVQGSPAASVATVESQFTEMEVGILKALAKKLLEKHAQKQVKPAKPKKDAAPRRTVAKEPRPAPQFTPPPPEPAKPAMTKPGVRKIGASATRPFIPAALAPSSSLLARPLPETIKHDNTLRIVDGKMMVQARTADGDPLTYDNGEPVMRDVTPVATPAPGSIQPLPTPSVAQSNLIAGLMAQVNESKPITGIKGF